MLHQVDVCSHSVSVLCLYIFSRALAIYFIDWCSMGRALIKHFSFERKAATEVRKTQIKGTKNYIWQHKL